MKKIFIILAFLISTVCFADTSLNLSVYTSNFSGDSYNFNEKPRLIGIEHNNWYIQYMKNEYNDDTFSLSRNFYYKKRVFLGLGLIKGYNKTENYLYSEKVGDKIVYGYAEMENKNVFYKDLGYLIYFGVNMPLYKDLSSDIVISGYNVNISLKLKMR